MRRTYLSHRTNTSNTSECMRNDCPLSVIKCACKEATKTNKFFLSFEFPRSRKRLFNRCRHREKVFLGNGRICHDNVHITVVDSVNNGLQRLSNQPLDVVASDGIANLFGHGQPDFQSLFGFCAQKQQVPCSRFFAFAVNVGKRSPLFESELLLHVGLRLMR